MRDLCLQTNAKYIDRAIQRLSKLTFRPCCSF